LEIVQSLSTISFPLLVLPSRIDDSSRKPRLLDLAERAMICSPGVLHARPSNSMSQVSPSFSIFTRFSIYSLPPTKLFPPILQVRSEPCCRLFHVRMCLLSSPFFPAGYNLVKRSIYLFLSFPLSSFLLHNV